MVIFLKNVFSALIMRFISQKSPKNLENMMKKKCFFEEETLAYFKIASLPNWEGAK